MAASSWPGTAKKRGWNSQGRNARSHRSGARPGARNRSIRSNSAALRGCSTGALASSASLDTASGAWAAICMAIMPPSECPARATGPRSRWAARASASPAHSGSESGASSGRVRPVLRLSGRITVNRRDSGSTSGPQLALSLAVPAISIKGGPLPSIS